MIIVWTRGFNRRVRRSKVRRISENFSLRLRTNSKIRRISDFSGEQKILKKILFSMFQTVTSKSFVWRYMKRNCEKTKVECQVCRAILSFCGSSTKSMADHLNSKHQITKDSVPETAKKSMKIETFASDKPVIFK